MALPAGRSPSLAQLAVSPSLLAARPEEKEFGLKTALAWKGLDAKVKKDKRDIHDLKI